MKLGGVIVPVAVPLNSARAVDAEGLERLVEHLVASGVDGLFANGSMGGFAFHDDAVQAHIVELIGRFNRGRKPLLAGISDTSAARVIARACALRDVPVDAFVALPPYYYIYDQPALIRFFETLADRLPRPLVLYENPRLAHNSLAPASIARLAAHPNVAGIKVSTPDPALWRELLSSGLPRERFALIAGAEKLMNEALRLGFDGITGGFHNLFPAAAVAMLRAARAGDFTRVDELQAKLNRGYRAFELAGGWRGLEIALRYMGVAAHAAPHPFDTPPAPGTAAEILDILRREECPVPYPARSMV